MLFSWEEKEKAKKKEKTIITYVRTAIDRWREGERKEEATDVVDYSLLIILKEIFIYQLENLLDLKFLGK